MGDLQLRRELALYLFWECDHSMLNTSNLPIALTVHQAAELLNLCDRTVYRMCVDGELKAVKLRKSWRINRDAVLQLLGTEAE